MTPLIRSRKNIDVIDKKILKLLAARMGVVQEIGSIKRTETDSPLRDVDREGGLFESWSREGEALGLSGYFVARILRELLDHSRRAQERLIHERDDVHSAVRVAFQGVSSAYGELALGKLFATRDSAPLESCGYPSFTACVDALESGDVDYALLPIENTIAGSINDVYRLLAERRVHIVDEEEWNVEHCLLGMEGARLDGLRVIRSHPVALQQCTKFLDSMVGCVEESVFDTAGAAAQVANEGDATAAAVASEASARRYGLEVLKRGIADRKTNRTRFLLVAREPEDVDERLASKTSLLFTVNHEQGALASCLQSFASRGLSLSKIESRPLGETPWEYLFYLDVEAHGNEPALRDALEELRAHTNHLRVLGTYPRHSGQNMPGASGPPDSHVASRAATMCPRPLDPSARSNPSSARLCARSEGRESTVIRIGDAEIGGDRFALIAGPCAVESRPQIQEAADMVRRSGALILRGGAYKPRTSPYSFQGLGHEGIIFLAEAGRGAGLPVVTEVLRPEDVDSVAEHVDMLQVGARNMQNFALLEECGRSHRPILLKRGISATIEELLLAAEYVLAAGNNRVVLCERGIRTFETATRSTLDISAIPVLKERTHLPVIVDPSHAAGVRHLVVPLALAAAAAGADGLIVEAHPDPESGLCDKEQALHPGDLEELVVRLDPILASQGRRR